MAAARKSIENECFAFGEMSKTFFFIVMPILTHIISAQSSGIRMLDGDTFVLRVKYAAATNGENSPVGLRLRHRIESGGGSEQLVEHPLPLESTCEVRRERRQLASLKLANI